MLKGTFFDVIDLTSAPGKVNAVLKIDPAHKIFEGHFPGQPVVPGVCMMQMVKEVLEISISCKLRISGADYLKFLTVLDPGQDAVINAELKYSMENNNTIHLIASLSNEDTIYFKMKSTFLQVIDNL